MSKTDELTCKLIAEKSRGRQKERQGEESRNTSERRNQIV